MTKKTAFLAVKLEGPEVKPEDRATEIRPSGATLPGDFWQAMSFDELAAAQRVGPLTNIDVLIGTWPGEMNDGFEEAVHKLRQASRRAG